MQTVEKRLSNPASVETNLSTPNVFTIPVIYEDAFLVRDRRRYLRVQALQKHSAELKENIRDIIQQHEIRYRLTKEAILQSSETLNRCLTKRRQNFVK